MKLVSKDEHYWIELFHLLNITESTVADQMKGALKILKSGSVIYS